MRISGTSVALVAVTSILAPASAEATFPGVNGRIAFQGPGYIGGAGVVSVNADGSVPGVVADGSAPAWSADGRQIALANGGIQVINADGTGQRQLTPTYPATGQEPAWSPDGTRIAYSSSGNGDGDIYVINADGTGSTRLTSFEGTGWAGQEDSPAWSPDGKRIAFVRHDAGFADIWVMNPDGSGAAPLTSNSPADRDLSPSWSPDGRRLVVSHGSGPNYFGGGAIHAINSDGSGRVTLLDSSSPFGPAGGPTWSPDGRQIAFERITTGTNVYTSHIHVMNADGTNARRLTTGAANESAPDWGSGTAVPRPFQLTLTGRRVQRVKRLHVLANCSDPCAFVFATTVSLGRGRTLTTRGNRLVRKGGQTKVDMKFGPRSRRAIRRLLRQGGRAVARVKFRTFDYNTRTFVGPRSVTAKRKIKLKG